MSKPMKFPILVSGMLISLLGVSVQSYASLTGDVSIDFEAADDTGDPMPSAVFPSFGQVYLEDGVEHTAIGFGTSPGNSIGVTTGGTSHMHGSSTGGSNTSQLEADSGGGLFQLADGDAFSIAGLDVAALNLGLADGSSSTMTFRGYTNAGLSNSVDLQIDQSANGTTLDFTGTAGFSEIYLLEYFFDAPGRGNDPGTTPNFANLVLELDNVALGAIATAPPVVPPVIPPVVPPVVPPVAPPAPVPLPAAVYLFGTGLLGLFGYRRKNVDVSLG